MIGDKIHIKMESFSLNSMQKKLMEWGERIGVGRTNIIFSFINVNSSLSSVSNRSLTIGEGRETLRSRCHSTLNNVNVFLK